MEGTKLPSTTATTTTTTICHLVAFQTRVGDDIQATIGTGGLPNSAGTTVHLLLTSGDEPSHVDTRGWCYSPRRLSIGENNSKTITYAPLSSWSLWLHSLFNANHHIIKTSQRNTTWSIAIWNSMYNLWMIVQKANNTVQFVCDYAYDLFY